MRGGDANDEGALLEGSSILKSRKQQWIFSVTSAPLCVVGRLGNDVVASWSPSCCGIELNWRAREERAM